MMYSTEIDERPHLRKVGTRVSIQAALTPATVYTLSTGRTAKLVRIVGYNGQPADVILEIGTGLGGAWARVLPRIRMIAGMPLLIDENECGGFEFEANITAQVSAAGAPAADVEVQLTVDEIGG